MTASQGDRQQQPGGRAQSGWQGKARQDGEQAGRQSEEGSKTTTRQTASLLGIHEVPLQKATEARQAESDGAYDSAQTLCLCKYVRSSQ